MIEYDKIITSINNDYLKNYQEIIDDIDKKILYRKAFCLEKVKKYEDCLNLLLELDKRYPNDKEIQVLLDVVRGSIKIPNDQSDSFKKGFLKKNIFENDDPGYYWEEEADGICLDCNIEDSEEILYKNLSEFN